MTDRLTRAQAATEIGISLRTLDRLIAQRRITHRKLGSRVFFTPADIKEFLDTCTIPAGNPSNSTIPNPHYKARPTAQVIPLRRPRSA